MRIARTAAVSCSMKPVKVSMTSMQAAISSQISMVSTLLRLEHGALNRIGDAAGAAPCHKLAVFVDHQGLEHFLAVAAAEHLVGLHARHDVREHFRHELSGEVLGRLGDRPVL